MKERVLLFAHHSFLLTPASLPAHHFPFPEGSPSQVQSQPCICEYLFWSLEDTPVAECGLSAVAPRSGPHCSRWEAAWPLFCGFPDSFSLWLLWRFTSGTGVTWFYFAMSKKDFFLFVLFGICWDSWVWGLVSFTNSRKSPALPHSMLSSLLGAPTDTRVISVTQTFTYRRAMQGSCENADSDRRAGWEEWPMRGSAAEAADLRV